MEVECHVVNFRGFSFACKKTSTYRKNISDGRVHNYKGHCMDIYCMS